MKVTLKVEGSVKLEVALSYEDVASIVSNLDDSPENKALFSALSEYPSSYARENLAGKDNLDEAAVKRLAADPDISVVRALASYSASLRRDFDTKSLLKLADRDPQVAEAIASYAEQFEAADIEDLTEELIKHPDCRVRYALANNSSTPKKHLRTLLKDVDSRIARAAKMALS